jgi:5-methylcytosine-specific restriction endonuclease McrA
MKNGVVYGRFELAEVLPYIGKTNHRFYCPDLQKTVSVKLGTQRMLLLKRQQACACCGLRGLHFVLEKTGFLPPHFNLYGVGDGGTPVMLTMDHVLPKSKGGQTAPDNLQLLCNPCNRDKGSHTITLDELRVKRGLATGPHTAPPAMSA